MVDLAAYLRSHQAKFVEQASRALTRGEGLRVSVEGQVARFYELLASAVESGSSERLGGLMKDWVDSRSAPSGAERQTLVPVILALKNSTWEVLLGGVPTDEAAAALVPLEPIFSAALQQLVELEIAGVVVDLERQLSEIRADLQKIDKTKSDFIAVASHELKSPLTLIDGYSKMITNELSADDFPRVHTLLAGVNTGTRRLREIVDDMVDVSLIDNRLLSLSYQPVRLRRLFEIIVGELEDVVRQRRLQLRVDDFDDGGRPTLADAERLYQVFRNVLLNAVKFTPDGGAITVGARQLPGFVEITVADTGIGIAPEDQQRIFEKFGGLGDVLLHSSSKINFKGRGPGLGLTIARGVLEAHGGAIWCESPGCDEEKCPGSTFHLLVPMRSGVPQDLPSNAYVLKPEEIELLASLKKS